METIRLCNALPNSFLPKGGQRLQITGLWDERVKQLLSDEPFQSFVGHESVADILTARLGIFIPHNREFCPPPTKTQPVLVAAVTPPRRLAEGEFWTQDDFLTMPIKWLWVEVK